MTENKINYQLNNDELPEVIKSGLIFYDYLTSAKYNWNNISLNPFQVIWLSYL